MSFYTGYTFLINNKVNLLSQHAALRRKSKDWLARNQNNVI